jgi:uncharacterized protein YndB with AHSA1/START domain
MEHVEKSIFGEVVIPAGIDAVWEVWTTPEGIRSFFAPDCRIKIEPDGPFEIIFMPEAEPGQQGSEGMRVMAVQPKKMLSFTWNAPPTLPEIRGQRTQVVVRFYPVGEMETKVTITHHGWGEGGQWDEAYEYFDRAWKRAVLKWLKYRFEHGPIDWDNPPK